MLGTRIMLKIWMLRLIPGQLILLHYISPAGLKKEMIERFGDDYAVYMKETKMFIPFVL
jgi:protein-S-isoprenylcysteine O-methyltransferase Ste14